MRVIYYGMRAACYRFVANGSGCSSSSSSSSSSNTYLQVRHPVRTLRWERRFPFISDMVIKPTLVDPLFLAISLNDSLV